jgi:hypothetical protein
MVDGGPFWFRNPHNPPGLREFVEGRGEELGITSGEIRALRTMWSTTRGDRNFGHDVWEQYLLMLRKFLEES